ncbi:MAG: hypothetical protein HN531_09510 [Opitutae bacterium]|nr:hypothetical protein [Opitutae bacterium]
MRTDNTIKAFLLTLLLGWLPGLQAQDSWFVEREFEEPVKVSGFKNPRGIAFGPGGKIIVSGGERMQIVDTNGTNLAFSVVDNPIGCVFAGDKFYVTSHDDDVVHVYDANGTGTHLFNFGGGGAANGKFITPGYVAADYNGSELEIFVADWSRDDVQVFDQMGVFKRKFSTVDGNPRGIAIDDAGHIYVADASDKVNVFSKDGTLLRTIPNIPGRPTGLSIRGNRLAVGQEISSGDGDHVVRIYDTNGSLIREIGQEGTGPGQFNQPRGVAYDSSGNLWVTDYGNHRIQIFDQNGNFIRQFGEYSEYVTFRQAYASVMDGDGKIYVSEQQNHRVVVLSEDGKFERVVATKGTQTGQVTSPRGLALDQTGNLYVADSGNKRVQVFAPDGSYLRTVGSPIVFASPWGVTVNDAGQLFVSDYTQNRIHVFDNAGNLLNSWGETGLNDNQLNQPMGLDVGPSGDLYVAAYNHFGIQRFSPSGELKQLIRTSVTTSNYRPRTMAVRKDGWVFTVADTSSDSITFAFDQKGSLVHYKGLSAHGLNGSVSVRDDGTVCWYFPYKGIGRVHMPSFRAGPTGQADGVPLTALLDVSQPENSTNLNVSYQVTDADSSTVTTGLLGFINGGTGLGSVIIPQTFVGGTTGKLGPNVDVNQTKTVTWNLAADWPGTVGSLAIEVLAKDDRALLDLHLVQIPADENNATALTINRFPLTDEDFLSAWLWLLATGDTGIKFEQNIITTPTTDLSAPATLNLSGKLLWLDASDLDGDGQPNTEANGSKVSIWMDKSGNDYNASQSVVENQPIYLSDDGSGKPALQLGNQWFNATGVNFNAKQIFVVTKARAVSNDHMAIISRGVDKGQLRALSSSPKYNNTASTSFAFGSGGELRINGAVGVDFPLGTPHIVSAKLGSGSTYAGHYQNMIIGRDDHNSDRWDGNVYEVIVFDRFLNTDETRQTEWYLAQKWGIQGPIPSGSGVYAAEYGSTSAGRAFLLAKMNLREASPAEKNRALEATTPGSVTQLDPELRIEPGGNPEKVNEFGIESLRTGTWVVPN